MSNTTTPSFGFWIIAAFALMWNIAGVAAFYMQISMTPDALALLPADQQELYIGIPLWAKIAFCIGVVGSTLASILLIMRKKIASTLFVIAFVGIVIEMVYSLFLSGSIKVYGPGGAILPVLVILVGLYLIYFSRQSKMKGWLL